MKRCLTILFFILLTNSLSCKQKSESQVADAKKMSDDLASRMGPLKTQLPSYLERGPAFDSNKKQRLDAVRNSSAWDAHTILVNEGTERYFYAYHLNFQFGEAKQQLTIHPQASIYNAIEVRNLLAQLTTENLDIYKDVEKKISYLTANIESGKIDFPYLSVGMPNFVDSTALQQVEYFLKPISTREAKSIFKLMPGSLFVAKIASNSGRNYTNGFGFGIWLGSPINPPSNIIVLATPSIAPPRYIDDGKNDLADAQKFNGRSPLAEQVEAAINSPEKIQVSFLEKQKMVYFAPANEAYHKQLIFGKVESEQFIPLPSEQYFSNMLVSTTPDPAEAENNTERFAKYRRKGEWYFLHFNYSC